ncbi:hypothetical protein WAI453_005265 [Rhynchosporium graminicola]
MKPAEAYAWFITAFTHENKLHDEGIFGGYGGTDFPLWRLIDTALRRCIDDQRRFLKAGISTTTIPQEFIHTDLEDTKREELEKEQKKEEGTEGVTVIWHNRNNPAHGGGYENIEEQEELLD